MLHQTPMDNLTSAKFHKNRVGVTFDFPLQKSQQILERAPCKLSVLSISISIHCKSWWFNVLHILSPSPKKVRQIRLCEMDSGSSDSTSCPLFSEIPLLLIETSGVWSFPNGTLCRLKEFEKICKTIQVI